MIQGLFDAKNSEEHSVDGNGTNCEREMAHACRLAGSDEVDIVYIHEILNGEKRLDEYHFLNLPGGFLDGDDLGSAKAGANRIVHAKVKGSGEPLRVTLSPVHPRGKTDPRRLQRLPAHGQARHPPGLRRRVLQTDGDALLQRLGAFRGPLGLARSQREVALRLHKGVEKNLSSLCATARASSWPKASRF